MPISEVPARFDIHAASGPHDGRHTSFDVALETQMKKILIATTIVLLSGTSLAFAKTAPISNIAFNSLHCSSVEQQFSKVRSAYKSGAAFQAAEEKAMSLCRQDRHKEVNERGEVKGPARS